jgi:hypothetical protein
LSWDVNLVYRVRRPTSRDAGPDSEDRRRGALGGELGSCQHTLELGEQRRARDDVDLVGDAD